MRNETGIILATAVLVCAQPVNIVAQESRVEYCGVDSCEQNGRGYTMCERFRAALNAIPQTDPLPVCDVALPDPGFSSPGWQELPINDNLQTIYDIEMYLTIRSPGDHNYTTWPEYFPDRFWMSKDDNTPSTWRRVPYELWRADYQARIQSGDIVPRLSSAVVRLNERGPQELIKYERIAGQCEQWMREFGFSRGGGHIFTGGDGDSPVYPLVGWSTGDMDVLVYEGRGVFVNVESGSKAYYAIGLLVARSPDPANPRRGYAATQRCGLRGIQEPEPIVTQPHLAAHN